MGYVKMSWGSQLHHKSLWAECKSAGWMQTLANSHFHNMEAYLPSAPAHTFWITISKTSPMFLQWTLENTLRPTRHKTFVLFLQNILPNHYGAKLAQIEKWPCISAVHDKIVMKFGHQIACGNTKHLKNFNDIYMTSNDLEMTFNSVFSTYLILGPGYCPLIIQ